MISVIIVSWNVRDLLKKCLESIFNFGQGVDFEIIAIDNASSDGTVEMLKQNFNVVSSERRNPLYENKKQDKGSLTAFETTKNIVLIKNDINHGFAKANNLGIRKAQGKYILLLNPDTEFIENSLEKVIQKMDSDESIGVLGCKLLNPDKTIQPSVRRFPTISSQLAILSKLYKLFPVLLNKYLIKDFDYGTPPLPLLGEEGIKSVEVDQVMGAFFCVRKSLFDKIGLLDEGYFIWFEEVDFCRRAKQAGYKVVYWPGTYIIHHGGQSFAQQMTLRKQLWFFKSAWRYFTK